MTARDPSELMQRAFAALQRRAWGEAAGFANTVLEHFGPEANALMVLGAVLSCFQQRFGMNVAMYQLLRLDTAAAYYDAVMRLIEVSRGKLPLALHVVKYEDIVARFEATVRELLTFLELEWDERVRRYTETARERTISTPSASQVVRPLYGSARGKWRNYRAFLEPCLPMLAPWVQTFGYEPM